MDGPLWTFDEIRELWTRSGGSAAYANIASAVAMATSGGRPSYVAAQSDGTVNRGLWGINSSHGQMSTNDPIANARGAVELSNNGTDWRDWQATYDSSGYLGPMAPVRNLVPSGTAMGQYPMSGNQPTTQVQSGLPADPSDVMAQILTWLGLPAEWFKAYLRYAVFILLGASMMVMGLIVMFVSLRQVKNVGSFVLETGAAGVGFGAGAAILSGDRRRMRTALQPPKPPPATGSARVAPTPPTPPSPSGRHSKGVSVEETLLRSRHRTPVSEGGKALGSPVIVKRTSNPLRAARRKTSTPSPQSGPFTNNREPRSPITGETMVGRRTNRRK